MVAKSRNLYSTSCADNLPCPCKKGQNKKKMRALNGRLPQNDRLDRRISHRRMTIALGMATTWQICWSRTSWQLTWCVCVRCLVGNVILVKQFCGVELVKTILMSVFMCDMIGQCCIEVFRQVNYWEPIFVNILTTSWWMECLLAMKYSR